MFNLLKYNVAGGGDSALYGVEDSLYYLRTGFLAFNAALPAALLALPAELFAALVRRRRPRWDLLAVVASFYLWAGFMTAIPHKEERFLYVVYPQARARAGLCCFSSPSAALRVVVVLFGDVDDVEAPIPPQIALAAALTFDSAIEATQYTPGSGSWMFLVSGGVRLCAAAAVAGSVVVSCSRVGALMTGYSAPIPAFSAVSRVASASSAAADGGRQQPVCVGAEWYRFPSSFFLSGGLRPAFVNRGFTGATLLCSFSLLVLHASAPSLSHRQA